MPKIHFEICFCLLIEKITLLFMSICFFFPFVSVSKIMLCYHFLDKIFSVFVFVWLSPNNCSFFLSFLETFLRFCFCVFVSALSVPRRTCLCYVFFFRTSCYDISSPTFQRKTFADISNITSQRQINVGVFQSPLKNLKFF